MKPGIPDTPSADCPLRFGIGQLFSTGPNIFRDRIFHVAGIRYSSEDAPVAKDWILNPGSVITRRLYEKSRISTARCQDAPRWQDIGPAEVTPFFSSLDVLFLLDLDHQLTYFRDIVLKKAPNPPVLIDLVTLAQFFLPDRTLTDTEDLIERSIPEQRWKRSDPRLPLIVSSASVILRDILSVLFHPVGARQEHLVCTLLEQAAACPDAPQDLVMLSRVVAQAHQIKWSDDLFTVSFEPPRTFPLDGIDGSKMLNILRTFLPPVKDPEKRTEIKSDQQEPADTLHLRSGGNILKPVRVEDVNVAFDKLAADIPSIQPRESQRLFARFCADAINRGGIYAVEAGTGTGKTLGYLVPACEFVRRNPGKQFVIVTATKNLQNQVADQELRKLTSGKSLYRDIHGAVLKGKANYLCVTALADLYEYAYTPGGANAESRLAWLHLLLVLIRCNGELEVIPWSLKRRLPILLDYLEEVNAQASCVSSLCRLGPTCIYPRHLREAVEADIVVTNQHKLATLTETLLDKASVCLVDEADLFSENFRSSVQVDLSDTRVRRRFIQRLTGSGRRQGYAELLQTRFTENLSFSDDESTHRALQKCITSTKSILSECAAVDDILTDIGNIPGALEFGEYRWLRLRSVNAGDRLRKLLEQLAARFENLALHFDNILNSGRYDNLEKERDDRTRRILTTEKIRVEQFRNLSAELKNEALTIASDYPSCDFVHVYCHQNWGWTVIKIPYDISGQVEQILLKTFSTTIFTSATLFVDDGLDLFTQELFLKKPVDGSLRIPSPFDYKNHVFAAVTTFIKPFRWRDPPAARKAWLQEIASTIAALVVATYGRTLVLFTNAREMKEVFRRISPLLLKYDIEPLIQDGTSLAEINAFRATEYSVLFGVDRFWTGVDFPGPTLSQVIVVRIPNPNLNDPLIEHRREQLGSAFWSSYYRRVTRLKLKQGFGRLIRSEKDRGIFVMLDGRVVDDPRMRSIQNELPVSLQRFSRRVTGAPPAIQELVSQGLKMLNLHREFEERHIDLLHL